MAKTINKKGVPEAYIDRDLSWMYFNRRILQEATKPNIPLLERLSFLGIYSNNLDEFFRVRMATLSRIAEYERTCCPAHQANHQAEQQIRQGIRGSHTRGDGMPPPGKHLLAEGQ